MGARLLPDSGAIQRTSAGVNIALYRSELLNIQLGYPNGLPSCARDQRNTGVQPFLSPSAIWRRRTLSDQTVIESRSEWTCDHIGRSTGVSEQCGSEDVSGHAQTPRIFKGPFTDIHPYGPSGLFTSPQIDEMLTILTSITINAHPQMLDNR